MWQKVYKYLTPLKKISIMCNPLRKRINVMVTTCQMNPSDIIQIKELLIMQYSKASKKGHKTKSFLSNL